MANLKKITELPVIESTEGLNLIVNDNGEAKKIAADSVGKVKTVNGVEPDKNGNVKIEMPEGFSGSWNDLTDKPSISDFDLVVKLENNNPTLVSGNFDAIVNKVKAGLIPIIHIASVEIQENGDAIHINNWAVEHFIIRGGSYGDLIEIYFNSSSLLITMYSDNTLEFSDIG